MTRPGSSQWTWICQALVYPLNRVVPYKIYSSCKLHLSAHRPSFTIWTHIQMHLEDFSHTSVGLPKIVWYYNLPPAWLMCIDVCQSQVLAPMGTSNSLHFPNRCTAHTLYAFYQCQISWLVWATDLQSVPTYLPQAYASKISIPCRSLSHHITHTFFGYPLSKWQIFEIEVRVRQANGASMTYRVNTVTEIP